MKLIIKILRDKINNENHKGMLCFESGTVIPFSVTNDDLNDIHYDQILRDTQTANGANIYQATFEIASEE